MQYVFDISLWLITIVLIVVAVILAYQCLTMTPEEFWSSYTVYGKKKLNEKSDTDKKDSDS